MSRRKTIPELRTEIMASEKLKAKSQEEISSVLDINQATLSRILRGKFRRLSPAVDRVCIYASISRMTEQPMGELEASLDRLSLLASGGSAHERHAMKLIRLAAELLESGDAPAVPARRQRPAS
jgi:transcriptional regulator with XRE-family HTH domain